jgi:hypothetical protein
MNLFFVFLLISPFLYENLMFVLFLEMMHFIIIILLIFMLDLENTPSPLPVPSVQ